MFQSIVYVSESYELTTYYTHYRLTDSDFEPCEVKTPSLNIPNNDALAAWHRDSWTANAFMAVPAIIPEYERRGLNVSRNIALLYLWFARRERFDPLRAARVGLWWLNSFYPQLDYPKYYPCVINQIKQLTYGRRK